MSNFVLKLFYNIYLYFFDAKYIDQKAQGIFISNLDKITVNLLVDLLE